jgi:Na+/H+-dicarboxylate symporter
MKSHLWIGIGLIAGIVVGIAAYWLSQAGHPQLAAFAAAIRPIGTLFLNLLSMVVIPLVATALFSGIAKLGDLRTVGRLVVRTLAFFWVTALVAIALGFLIGALIVPQATVTPEQQVALRAAAAALNGLAGTNCAINCAPLTNIADAVVEALIRIVHWVLLFAPVGIFALVAPIVSQFGWNLVLAMVWFMAAVIAGTLVFIAVVYLPCVSILGRLAPLPFLRAAFPSMLMGFSTTTSLAALPTMIDAADKELHLPRPVSGFVLPLGATINRGGSALYQAVAVLFIARLYGIPFGIAQMFQAGAAVFLASLTVAAVPSGSVLSLFPAFQSTGLPIAGISILLGLDRIPDMFRTMTNVTGHLSGAVVVAATEDRV